MDESERSILFNRVRRSIVDLSSPAESPDGKIKSDGVEVEKPNLLEETPNFNYSAA